MKKAYLLLLSGALIIGTFASCNKEDVGDSNDQNVSKGTEKLKEVIISNGVLKFESEQAFENVMTSLYTTQREEALDAWESQFKGYTSMRKKTNSLLETYIKGEGDLMAEIINGQYKNLLFLNKSDGDIEQIDVIVDDHILATVINTAGLVQIGKDIYKFRYNNVYKVNEDNIESLNNIDSVSRQSLIDLDVEISPVKREILDFYDTESQSLGFGRLCGTPNYDPDGNGSARERRFRGKRWKSTTALTSSLVTQTLHFRRKKRRGWKESDAPYIYTSAHGTYSRILEEYDRYVNKRMARIEKSRVKYVIDRCFFVPNVGPCAYDKIMITTKHGGNGIDGRPYECIIYD